MLILTTHLNLGAGGAERPLIGRSAQERFNGEAVAQFLQNHAGYPLYENRDGCGSLFGTVLLRGVKDENKASTAKPFIDHGADLDYQAVTCTPMLRLVTIYGHEAREDVVVDRGDFCHLGSSSEVALLVAIREWKVGDVRVRKSC